MRMSNVLAGAALGLLLTPAAFAQETETMPRFPGLPLEKLNIDTSHSNISFEAPFMAVSTVYGRFDDFEGMLLFDEEDPTQGSIVVEIATESIHTANDRRDDHLRSDDFFDAENFPTIRFASYRIDRMGDGYIAVGTLSCHGVEKDIQIPFTVAGAVANDSWKNRRIVLNGSFAFDRRDFGVDGWEKKRFRPGADLIVAHEITVKFEIHGIHRRLDSVLDRLDDEKFAFMKEVWESLEANGVDATIKLARERAESSPPEGLSTQLNSLGYAALERGKIDAARAFLELDASLHPDSANTLDSLGEVAVVAGNTEQAREYFERSLEMDPGNLNAQILLAWMGR